MVVRITAVLPFTQPLVYEHLTTRLQVQSVVATLCFTELSIMGSLEVGSAGDVE